MTILRKIGLLDSQIIHHLDIVVLALNSILMTMFTSHGSTMVTNLCITQTLSSTSNTQSTTLIKQNTYTSYWNSAHVNLEIEISGWDDPWIIWSPYSNAYQYNQIFHYGSAIDESKDSAKYPADHDSDGTCDMLESATLDYGVEDMIFEMEMDLSYMPEYPAMIPSSVSINPCTTKRFDP